jgi:hypothetical protein
MNGVSRIICLDLNMVFATPNGDMLALVLAIGVIVAAKLRVVALVLKRTFTRG